MNHIVITSSNGAHYVAENEHGWFWTLNYNRARTFATKTEAEAFAVAIIPEMVRDGMVWFLGVGR